MIDRESVTKRLIEFADKFESRAELARLLGMKKPQQLQPYLTGKSLPGADLLLRLRKLGLDVHWLLSGETKIPSTPVFGEEKLQYDDDNMRLVVEDEVDRIVKVVLLWRTIEPNSARELRQMLRRWFIKIIRSEREKTGKAKKKKVSTK